MSDTSFVDNVITTANRVVAAWLNQVNKWLFWGRRPNYATTTGAANAQILTLAVGSLYTAGSEADGDEFWFTAGFTNTLTMTLQVLAPAAGNVARTVQLNSAALIGGEVVSGRTYKVTRLGTTWQLTSLAGTTYGTTLLQAATAAALRVLFTPLTTKGDLWGFSTVDARMAVGTDGQALQADSSQATGIIYIDNPSRPNLWINPNWQIDQINEGALYTVNTTGVNGPDGLSGTAVGAGVFKLRVVADPEHPSLKAVEITCTTADAAIAATDDYFLYTTIEGYDAAAFLYGESGAKAGTIQFPFKSSVPGVYGVSVMNSAGNRRYVGSITVPDTAEHDYSFSFTADTTGTWLFTNGVGVYLRICLAAGTNFQTATPLTWAAGAEQTVASQVNFMSSTSNIAYLKRAQFVPGALVQAYKPADIQKELAKTQRYYCKTFSQGVAPSHTTNLGDGGELRVSIVAAGGEPSIKWQFPVEMRTLPSGGLYGFSGRAAGQWTTGATDGANARFLWPGTRSVTIDNSGAAVASGNWSIHATAFARLS